MRWCCEVGVFQFLCDRMDSCVLALAGDQLFRRRLRPKQAGFEDNGRELIPWNGRSWDMIQTGVEAFGLVIPREQEAFRFWLEAV